MGQKTKDVLVTELGELLSPANIVQRRGPSRLPQEVEKDLQRLEVATLEALIEAMREYRLGFIRAMDTRVKPWHASV